MPASFARLVCFNAALLSCLPLCHGAENSVRETPLVRAVRECRGAIVNIHTEKSAVEEREARFLPQKERKVTGMGTGIVIDERGYIVTNCHVIHEVEQIIVTQEDGETYTADVVDFDTKHDLAILKVHTSEPMKVMSMGTSSDLMLAEQVFAVGNAFGYEHTVTAGIISAVSRDVEVDETQSYQNLIQTDASINPGNSGGPLLNLDGEIIGINVAIRAGAQRIGFAIPIDDARRVIANIMSTQRRSGQVHGMVGRDVNTPNNQHMVVDRILPSSPADVCGMQPGDIVRSVKDVNVEDTADWERSLLNLPHGSSVDVNVERSGEPLSLTLRMSTKSQPNKSAAVRSASVAANANTPHVGKTASAGAGMAWQEIGIRVAALSDRERLRLPSRYNGGMKILFVRSGSRGARYGLRNGDILVGLDGYETLGEANLKFVLASDRLKDMSQLSFQIVRNGNKALMGKIELAVPNVAARQTPARGVSGSR